MRFKLPQYEHLQGAAEARRRVRRRILTSKGPRKKQMRCPVDAYRSGVRCRPFDWLTAMAVMRGAKAVSPVPISFGQVEEYPKKGRRIALAVGGGRDPSAWGVIERTAKQRDPSNHRPRLALERAGHGRSRGRKPPTETAGLRCRSFCLHPFGMRRPPALAAGRPMRRYRPPMQSLYDDSIVEKRGNVLRVPGSPKPKRRSWLR